MIGLCYCENNNSSEYCNYCKKIYSMSKMYDLETCYSCNEIENSIQNFKEVLNNGYKYFNKLRCKILIEILDKELKYNSRLLGTINEGKNIVYKNNIIYIFEGNGSFLNEIAYELQIRINNILNNISNNNRFYRII